MSYYRILCDGYPLLDTRLEEYTVVKPTCTLELNKSGTLKFDIYPTHPYYNAIHKLSSVITLLENDTIIFQGRVLDDDINFDNAKSVVCEGELAYLLDSIVRPYEYTGSVSGMVTKYIVDHNAQVEAKKRFTVGQVTVTDPNDYITRAASAYPSTWNEVNDKLIKLLGGYIRLRYTEDVTYFDYVTNYGSVNNQVIEFGNNLLDLTRYIKGADIATRIIPLGKTLENDGDKGEEKRLTITGINNGKDYVEDAEAIERYGVITKTATFDDVTTESVLLQRGYQTLEDKKKLKVTIELTAFDLHLFNVDIERIKLGDYIRVKSPKHNVNEYMEVSKLDLDLDNPANNKITLGTTFSTLTNEASGNSKLEKDVATIKSDYVTNGAIRSIQEQVKNVITSNESSIDQSASEILLQVSSDYASKSEVESLQEQLSSSISQTDENIQFTFERTTMYTEQVEGELRGKFESLQTYYRFDEDGAEIGKSDSPFKARFSNTELGFYDNGQKVSYIGNAKMYITDAEVNNKLTVGNYENGYWDWIPRQNGNLSLKWRKGGE